MINSIYRTDSGPALCLTKYIFYYILILYLNTTGYPLLQKEKPSATKCTDHRTLSFDAKTAKIVARILRSRIGRKLRINVEISLDLEEQKEAESDITRIWDIDEEFCVCFIDWQKALTV